jgi:uridine kinase
VTSVGAKICAIAGGSGAGKTTLAFKVLDHLGDLGAHLTIDWYYRDLSHLTPEERAVINFDHPDSLEVDLFAEHLAQLESGIAVDAPIYDFATHTRIAATRHITARPFIVTEGIHLLGLEAVRARCSLLVFIDIDAELRLARRVRRDVAERGRTEASVREQWQTTVTPMHDRFVQPSCAFADRVATIDEDLDDVAAELFSRLVGGAEAADRQRHSAGDRTGDDTSIVQRRDLGRR